jgi:hypothetical protein
MPRAAEPQLWGVRLEIWVICVLFVVLALTFSIRTRDSTREFSERVLFVGESPDETRAPAVPVAALAAPDMIANSARSAAATSRAGGQSLSFLVQALSDPDPHVRQDALDELEGIRPSREEILPTLIACLRDVNPEVRGKAILMISQFGLEAMEAVPVLKCLSKEDTDPKVRSRAADALYNIRFYDYAIGDGPSPSGKDR